MQKAASSALQKLSRQLQNSARLVVHASVLNVLNRVAGHLSTESIVSLLDLLADNASIGGYLTQQSAQDLRLLALVKDVDLRTAASRAVAALPVAGSILTAAELKFAFLEKALLPLPVLKRASEQEGPPSATDPSPPTLTSAVAEAADENPEKQILLSPYPFAPCRSAARQLFGSGDCQTAIVEGPPATEGPHQGPRVNSDPPKLHASSYPSPLSPTKRAAPARSPLSPKSPSFSRSRDLARVSKSLPREHRAVSPPTAKTPKLTPTGSAKSVVASKEKTRNDPATRSPLQERVEMQRGGGGDQALAANAPFDRSHRTLGQVASQFRARKDVWKETAARKRETPNKIAGSTAAREEFLAARTPTSLPESTLAGAGLDWDVPKVTGEYEGLKRQVEWATKVAPDGNPRHQSLEVGVGSSHIGGAPRWDSLSIEEWLQLATLEEDTLLR